MLPCLTASKNVQLELYGQIWRVEDAAADGWNYMKMHPASLSNQRQLPITLS